MAIDTFTWCVRVGASGTNTVSTLQAQFGDGYKQVAGAGINTAAENWNLVCSGNASAMKAVRDFLRDHVIHSFWWVNPWGERKLFRVRGDSISPNFINGNFVEISFTFEQAFAP
ncbi:phage tail protein [Pseudescherichia vulneris]|uniref:phage tail protein n=1 Tax=Pseudescherichia vulneris TaxID=566 RepID=UPI00227D64AB|nr:phage tail protein [Pseudescherichia vulneris]WAH52494.1 phage tail protein [Pseudescherichia vulneris]